MNRQNATQREPRLFHLVRPADGPEASGTEASGPQASGTGASGTGTVAEGVVWTDGTVALRWRGRWPATSAWEGGLDAVLAVHGHGGSTVVRWLTVPLLRTTTEAAPAGTGPGGERPAPVTLGARVPTASPDGRCSRCGRVWPCLSCGP